MLDYKEQKSDDNSGHQLCFEKGDFLKENFSVDEFLHKNRHVPNLELLRDNLGLYLKALRSSLIDLINEDYTDFVSLSANLVGLDQSIENIQKPLHQLRDDIVDIKSVVDMNIEEIRNKLQSKHQLRILKCNLQSYKQLEDGIQKLNQLLDNQLNNDKQNVLKTVDLERAAFELLQLKHHQKFCREYLTEEKSSQLRDIESSIYKKLREFFINCLQVSNSTSAESLERCLRIYQYLDACHVAEEAFREDIVASYMSTIITEHNLQNTPQGLAGIYSKVLNFISLHMTDLLRLTQYTDKLHGFNFLVRSFWVDVVMRLETHMTSIFAPGNAEIFYAKYKCTKDFLSKIEELLANEEDVTAFRQHKQTRGFLARWNLPVYFQICFQEIAGDFEAILEPVLSKSLSPRDHDKRSYHFQTFPKAKSSISRCWSNGVYIDELFSKFFKLNLQIILRLIVWTNDVIQQLASCGKESSTSTTKMDLLFALHSDLQRFILEISDNQEVVVNSLLNSPALQKQMDSLKDVVGKVFADVEDKLQEKLLVIQEILVENFIRECSENIRQVNDLPRLYRKTNRDLPTRCSTYIEQMLKPLNVLTEQQSQQLGQVVINNILEKVFTKLTDIYFSAVNDVLTSVQRTEESLRRLKNLKGGGGVGVVNPSSTITDDDKIRLQLQVDVSTWTTELSKFGFTPLHINKLMDLNNLVEKKNVK